MLAFLHDIGLNGHMKPLNGSHFLAASIAIITGAVLSARAQTAVSVDEFGIGAINGNSLSSQSAGSHGLQYSLPYVTVPGSVEILDPLAGNQISDVIIFTNTSLFFQSDSQGGAHSPADVSAFTIDTTQIVQIQEQVSGGNSFATYTPTIGMPGYSSLNPTYDFISDVPEPGCCLLMAGGGAVLLFLRRIQVRKETPSPPE